MSINLKYGIDLGTTNSCIASCDADSITVFRNNDQMNVTPSAVLIEKSGRTIVGRRAFVRKGEHPDDVQTEFKRWMGQKDTVSFAAAGKRMSAEELSAEVLKSVLGDARRQTGDTIDAAVITVPAAFGQLQCEATSRAARLAGLQDAPLLQEPIAAAIAYGIAPQNRNQRWLVFDLGGGTFDVALISSKDGTLRVLEHRGDNLLGGKDIDKLIVDKVLWSALSEEFSLPNPRNDQNAYRRLHQRLRLKAEEAKIDLSTQESTTISLFDIGDDIDGNEIEYELNFTREQLEAICSPVFERCLDLCQETLGQLKLGKLDRILLVGGPTQMPYLRSLLSRRLNAPVDFSQDPMTVVARGAAIYATTIEDQSRKGVPIQQSANGHVELAYEAISSELTCTVEGKVNADATQVKVEAESGHWTSGWLDLEDGFFEVDVCLLDGRSSRFKIELRDASGKPVPCDNDSFVIRHGLALSAPPLPHSVGAELAQKDGTAQLDVVFKRGTTLPCLTTRMYQASKTLRPTEADSLVIKLWEGEIFNEPAANDWVGCMLIESHQLVRPLPEGSPIEVTFAMDVSRHLRVEAYIPRLEQHFRETVYVAQREEKEFVELAQELPSEIEKQVRKIEHLQPAVEQSEAQQLKQIRSELEDLDIELGTGASVDADDPEEAKRLVERSKALMRKVSSVELGLDANAKQRLVEAGISKKLVLAQDLVDDFGSESDKTHLSVIRQEVDRALKQNDDLALRRAEEELRFLNSRILWQQDWFVENRLKEMRNNTRFQNKAQAEKLMDECERLLSAGNIDAAGDIISDLFQLLPQSETANVQEKLMKSGIKKAQ